MSGITNIIRDLPEILLSLPIVLLALSFHEMSHGYAAHLLGDNTARNLGRLTLNPAKHLDLIGTLCMVFFHVGWAKPVPITVRNFKKPRRDMALTAIAGPVSNLFLSFIFVLLFRVTVLLFDLFWEEELYEMALSFVGYSADISKVVMVFSILAYVFYIGISVNISFAIFNLIPVPPLDGSRFFYMFLPAKFYFGIMKYERYIMIALLVLLYLGVLTTPISWICTKLIYGAFFITGMPEASPYIILNYAQSILMG